MQRVHRNLPRDEVEALRERLAALVPESRAGIPELLRLMRLITRRSQTEYARLCGVAPRVLTAIEAGKASPTVETLEKLLRPFGYSVGIVLQAERPQRTGTADAGSRKEGGALERALRKSRGESGE